MTWYWSKHVLRIGIIMFWKFTIINCDLSYSTFWSVLFHCCFGKPIQILHPNCCLIFQKFFVIFFSVFNTYMSVLFWVTVVIWFTLPIWIIMLLCQPSTMMKFRPLEQCCTLVVLVSESPNMASMMLNLDFRHYGSG